MPGCCPEHLPHVGCLCVCARTCAHAQNTRLTLSCSCEWRMRKGRFVLVCIYPAPISTHVPCTPGPSCQVFSLFFFQRPPIVSWRNPIPSLDKSRGCQRRNPILSPSVPFSHLYNLSRFGCWVWVPGPGCHHLGNRGLWLLW